MPRHAMHPIQDLFLDCFSYVLQFGRKVMMFGGDFRKVLPIVPLGSRAQITDATLFRSCIWKDVWKICLTRNMRAQFDPWFLDYLLRIGNGTEDTFAGDYIHLPKDIVIEYKDEHSIDLLKCHVAMALRTGHTYGKPLAQQTDQGSYPSCQKPRMHYELGTQCPQPWTLGWELLGENLDYMRGLVCATLVHNGFE
jgi:hypothetical protein